MFIPYLKDIEQNQSTLLVLLKIYDVFILNTGKIYPIITLDSEWYTCSSDNSFAISWKWRGKLY